MHTSLSVLIVFSSLTAVGTCKMGTDASAVVGPDLRVKGIKNLRVAGCSIMPTLPSGNTQAPGIMVIKIKLRCETSPRRVCV